MSFDPQSFLESSVNSSNDTKVIPVAIGEYQGIIEKITPRQWTSRDGATSGIAIDLIWMVEDAAEKERLGRETVTVKQGIMLDTNKAGALDMSSGKNVALGRLREAVGLNEPGQTFTFSMLPGMSAKINVTHRIVGDDTFAEVKGVAKL